MNYNKEQVLESASIIIKKWESFKNKMYLCPAKIPTIGYGHVILPSDNIKPTDIITHERAVHLLNKDMEIALQSILKYVQVDLTSNQLAALVSFVFNIGVTAFKKSTMLRMINSKNYTGAAGQFSKWVYANGKILKGLQNRRIEECKLFCE